MSVIMDIQNLKSGKEFQEFSNVFNCSSYDYVSFTLEVKTKDLLGNFKKQKKNYINVQVYPKFNGLVQSESIFNYNVYPRQEEDSDVWIQQYHNFPTMTISELVLLVTNVELNGDNQINLLQDIKITQGN